MVGSLLLCLLHYGGATTPDVGGGGGGVGGCDVVSCTHAFGVGEQVLRLVRADVLLSGPIGRRIVGILNII